MVTLSDRLSALRSACTSEINPELLESLKAFASAAPRERAATMRELDLALVYATEVGDDQLAAKLEAIDLLLRALK